MGLTRQAASDAVSDLGWRLVLGTLRSRVPVNSLAQATEVAALATRACGDDADGHLWADLRPDRVVLSLRTLATARLGPGDLELARRITEELRQAGLRTVAEGVQVLEIAIDALDIPSVRPFWRAVMGYADEAGRTGPEDALVDPAGEGPAIWFQQMDAPRPQRNRIHIDVSVPHDEAPRRIDAALAAGGRVLSDAEAPAFWVLADPEGNEACVTTWQGRD
jgi:4a-hydroxytetrahydrobiopterin dehydratase